ncbi:hypothetical protein ACLB2K_008582 [Fragaria x ananassa]
MPEELPPDERRGPRFSLVHLEETADDIVSLDWIKFSDNSEQGKKFPDYWYEYIEIFGPRNGIYCLHESSRDHGHVIALMNVSSREFKLVPKPEESIISHTGFRSPAAVEIGFDPKTNDYKVFFFKDCSFLKEEMFTGWLLSATMLVTAVVVFNESLSLIVYPQTPDYLRRERSYTKCFDIWVMKDYGNERSWTKEFTTGPVEDADRLLAFCSWKEDEHKEYMLIIVRTLKFSYADKNTYYINCRNRELESALEVGIEVDVALLAPVES